MSEKYDYRIECDGMVIETNSMIFAAHIVGPEQEDIGEEEGEETACRKLPFKREKISTRKEARDVARDLFDEEPKHVPMQVREQTGREIEVDRLLELCDAWHLKSSNSNLPHAKRAAYCDAAEKLEAVIRGSPWTESP